MNTKPAFRIGVAGFLHESNTFVTEPTTLADFERATLVEGDDVRTAFAASHHEIAGFIDALDAHASAEVVPLIVARATPSGVIEPAAYEHIVGRLLDRVRQAGTLDGLLVAPHGATVSVDEADADGAWLERLRARVGDLPIVATLDAHANLSARMVRQCNAIIGYRTNPHLDQHARGVEAANLLLRHLDGTRRLHMAAVLPPVTINIERQCTDDQHLARLFGYADAQRGRDAVATNSILLGFPYADVPEMGSSVIAVADDSAAASQAARELAQRVWDERASFLAELVGVEEALAGCRSNPGDRTCLLDMGDNVGGGSPADGTVLLEALCREKVRDVFVCIRDPDAVTACLAAGAGAELTLDIGGHSDDRHGDPVTVQVRVRSLHEGAFTENAPRHGGVTHFDQGACAVVDAEVGPTVLLNSIRTAPFSLGQLTSCDLTPGDFRILVAKGVNAPIAAYREVCTRFIRVNTPGSTSADMLRMEYRNRRRPMHPFEADTAWSAADAEVVYGYLP